MSSGPGRLVGDDLITRRVELLRCEQHSRLIGQYAGGTDRDRDRCRGDVIGQIGDNDSVTNAEGEVEALDLTAEPPELTIETSTAGEVMTYTRDWDSAERYFVDKEAELARQARSERTVQATQMLALLEGMLFDFANPPQAVEVPEYVQHFV